MIEDTLKYAKPTFEFNSSKGNVTVVDRSLLMVLASNNVYIRKQNKKGIRTDEETFTYDQIEKLMVICLLREHQRFSKKNLLPKYINKQDPGTWANNGSVELIDYLKEQVKCRIVSYIPPEFSPRKNCLTNIYRMSTRI